LNFSASILSNPKKKNEDKNHTRLIVWFFVSKFFIAYVLHCAPIDIIEGQNLRPILWSLVSSLFGERGGEGEGSFATTISSKKSKFVGTHEDKNKILKKAGK
jgi:hypothetical protein